jgi:broad specificity phosphatase PhoE
MPLVILVRHGETSANRDRHFGVSDSTPLTERGEQQALELALKLRERFRSERLLSSHFQRARQTSTILARELGLTVELLPGIHERDFGYLKGLGYEHIPPVAYTDPAWTPEGGESRNELQSRVLKTLREALPRYTEKEILVVSHGAVIQSLCAHVNNTWENAHLPGNCGAVVVRYEDGRLEGLEIVE